jgi:branched-subunit amino acid aminotransferase/4-amino-4-deoxychorismate lyase
MVDRHVVQVNSARMGEPLRLEIDGRPVSAEVAASTMSAAGHFTAMQVRGGHTRGLALHLLRLEAANREMFDVGLDADRVLALIGHALGGIEDASVRVYFHETGAAPAIVVTVKPPGGIESPQRLRSVAYQRPNAHLKHLATEQGYHSERARSEGFDDALLTAADGTVSESATANIGFFDGTGIVWPDAPLLRGITMQLLERAVPKFGRTSRRAPVALGDVGSFGGAFLSNARGIAAVSEIDDHRIAMPDDSLTMLTDAYASVPWDPF